MSEKANKAAAPKSKPTKTTKKVQGTTLNRSVPTAGQKGYIFQSYTADHKRLKGLKTQDVHSQMMSPVIEIQRRENRNGVMTGVVLYFESHAQVFFHINEAGKFEAIYHRPKPPTDDDPWDE